MKTVVLVACVATKINKPAPAENLYDSDLFKKSMAYAHKLTDSNDIYILSAKHHLLPIKKVIKPYDMTLNDFSAEEKEQWASTVISELKNKGYDLDKDKFVFLAGVNYRKYLEDKLQNIEIPLKGLRIGQQKAKLAKLVTEIYNKIKKIVLQEIKKFIK
jgi:hypothetical protein